MKYYLCFLMATCCTSFSSGQKQNLFEVKEITLTDTVMQKRVAESLKEKPVLFEDEKYVIRRTCSGEWGGSVYFKNKLTNIERAFSATCAIAVLKIEKSYLVVSSRAHMSGFSSIAEIKDPELLKIFKLPSPKGYINGKPYRLSGDTESKSIKGERVLLDTIGVETLAAFTYHKRVFYIISDREGTFIAKVENKRFIHLDKIANENIWTYETMVKKSNGHSNVLFTGFKANGYIDIFDNKITVYYYK